MVCMMHVCLWTQALEHTVNNTNNNHILYSVFVWSYLLASALTACNQVGDIMCRWAKNGNLYGGTVLDNEFATNSTGFLSLTEATYLERAI